MTYPRIIPCCLIAVGLGWVFAEVRRFFFHPGYFVREADDNTRGNLPVSLVCGLVYLFIGAVLAFNSFGLGALVFTFKYPYLAAGPDTHRFLTAFVSGAVTWMILSAISAKLLPPPLFAEATTKRLCSWVRGILLVIWGVVMVLGVRHAGSLRSLWGIGLIDAAIALLAIATGSLWWQFTFCEWEVPAITCRDRPFPYAATVLLLIGVAALFLLLPPSSDAPSAIISAR